MTSQSIRTAVPWLCLAALAACAAPQTTVPPPEFVPQPVTIAPTPPPPPRPPPAEELEAYLLVRDDPAFTRLSADLSASAPAGRPAILMLRARETYAAARKIRAKKGGPLGFAGWSPARERFMAYCELALRDLDEILVNHPRSPEAPEALFTVGQIEDFPNRNQFDAALEAYRLTVERYPGTPWARQATERIRVIEDIFDRGNDGPLEGGASSPEPAR